VTKTADSVLVARAANGDIDAYEQLVRRYQLPIYRHCLNMLGNEGDAAEAAQDVFFTVWRALGRFRGDAASLPGSTELPPTAASRLFV
jgi:RNA polymerase sigma-70 factor (ECF subfamily)